MVNNIYYTIQLKNGIHRDSNPLFALPLTSWRWNGRHHKHWCFSFFLAINPRPHSLHNWRIYSCELLCIQGRNKTNIFGIISCPRSILRSIYIIVFFHNFIHNILQHHIDVTTFNTIHITWIILWIISYLFINYFLHFINIIPNQHITITSKVIHFKWFLAKFISS